MALSTKPGYKTLSSAPVFIHPRLTLAEDRIELPDGQQGDYLWFSGQKDAVTIIARDSAGKILVEREYSYLPNAALFQFAGGGVENGEQPEAAAQRELAEELEYQAGQLTWIGSYLIDHRRSHSKMHVFLGQDLSPCLRAAKDQYEVDLQHSWLTETEVDKLIAEGRVINAPMLAAWMLYKQHV